VTSAYHYVDLSGLTECFAFLSRPIEAGGGWTATVLFYRVDPTSQSGKPAPAVRRFGAFDSQEALLDHLEDWIRGTLSEHWERRELHDDYQPA